MDSKGTTYQDVICTGELHDLYDCIGCKATEWTPEYGCYKLLKSDAEYVLKVREEKKK